MDFSTRKSILVRFPGEYPCLRIREVMMMSFEKSGVKVMIVDDEVLVAMSLSDLLSRDGYSVVGTAGDGVEAVLMAGETRPDLVLMDILMPHKNGIEAIHEIRSLFPDTMFLIITAVQDENVLKEAEEAGAIGSISKPFKTEEILETLTGILEREFVSRKE